jgi:hypothetical protein
MRRAAIAISTALIAAPTLFAGAAQAQVQDRYGPPPSPTGLMHVSYGPDRPFLTWPGKQPASSDAPAQPPPPPLQPAPPPASVYAPPPAPSPPPASQPVAPPVSMYKPPSEPSPQPARQPMAPRVSAYTPPQPTRPPTADADVPMRPASSPAAPVASVAAPVPSPQVAHADLRMRPLLPASRPEAPVSSAAVPAPTPRVAHTAPPKPPGSASKAPVVLATAKPAPTLPDAAEPAPKPWSRTGPGLPPHFYSTAREFGLKPDPDQVPLSPQFFSGGSSADLAAPPPPLDPRAVPGSQTVGSTASANTPANRARAIALDTPSPDGSSN